MMILDSKTLVGVTPPIPLLLRPMSRIDVSIPILSASIGERIVRSAPRVDEKLHGCCAYVGIVGKLELTVEERTAYGANG